MVSRGSHTIKTRCIAVCAIVLAIWFNVALVSHQVDSNPSHHLYHHCELFSAAQHGLSQAMPAIPLIPSFEGFSVTFFTGKARTQHFAYLARSPPFLIDQ
ncbi:DUF2607 domain-containing protein [Photobacterium japonica]|uniref:DUF2607 family protein n=1 Tax=Photobacterium japonica TaxID=2910235 RepID=UPI003D1008A4